MTPPEFDDECRENARRMARDPALQSLTQAWIKATHAYKYTYNYRWLGRPIIQLPPDIVLLQEIIWDVKPDFIVETGIAHGGSVVFHASVLELLGRNGIVVGIDVDIRSDNRRALLEHPLAHRIHLVEGSSIDESTVRKVRDLVQSRARGMVILDSNHTHHHVLQELQLYSPMVPRESYLVVLDTIIEDFPPGSFPDRPWDRGNNPKTAVWEFLRGSDRFVIDKDRENKLLITVAPDGYLRCIKD